MPQEIPLTLYIDHCIAPDPTQKLILARKNKVYSVAAVEMGVTLLSRTRKYATHIIFAYFSSVEPHTGVQRVVTEMTQISDIRTSSHDITSIIHQHAFSLLELLIAEDYGMSISSAEIEQAKINVTQYNSRLEQEERKLLVISNAVLVPVSLLTRQLLPSKSVLQ